LSLAVTPVDNRPRQLNNLLITQKGKSGIVYCLSRKNTETYAKSLNDAGYKALAYHAGMSSEERKPMSQASFAQLFRRGHAALRKLR